MRLALQKQRDRSVAAPAFLLLAVGRATGESYGPSVGLPLKRQLTGRAVRRKTLERERERARANGARWGWQTTHATVASSDSQRAKRNISMAAIRQGRGASKRRDRFAKQCKRPELVRSVFFSDKSPRLPCTFHRTNSPLSAFNTTSRIASIVPRRLGGEFWAHHPHAHTTHTHTPTSDYSRSLSLAPAPAPIPARRVRVHPNTPSQARPPPPLHGQRRGGPERPLLAHRSPHADDACGLSPEQRR